MVLECSQYLNQYRKDNFKPVLIGKFKKLTYSSNLVTDKLFGDDLQKKIEDIQKSRKISISGLMKNRLKVDITTIHQIKTITDQILLEEEVMFWTKVDFPSTNEGEGGNHSTNIATVRHAD
jgi:hypothetical protein